MTPSRPQTSLLTVEVILPFVSFEKKNDQVHKGKKKTREREREDGRVNQLFVSKRACNVLFPAVQAGTDSYCVSVTLPYPTRHCMMNGPSRTYGPRRHLASLLPRAACLSPPQPCLERLPTLSLCHFRLLFSSSLPLQPERLMCVPLRFGLHTVFCHDNTLLSPSPSRL